MRARFVVAAALALSAAVLPAAQSPAPPPQSVIGWEPCADYKLANYEQIEAYFRKLADASPDRMRLVDIGPTTEGRRQIMAVISSEANIRQLDRFREISRRLAMARTPDGNVLSDADARALARDGRTVVWIDFGLHSTEVAHGQTAPLLAYKAVAENSAEMERIRDGVILLLVANMNPDGTDLVASWYRENLGKPWESRPPELWHKYVGHDDNRDWFMMTQVETRNSARQLYVEWLPQIVYNQHQSGPFPSRIFVPPFDDPMNPNIPPLVMRGVNLVGDAMTRRLDEEGKRGAVSRVGFDTWWNGGMRTAPYFHNMIGILTETGHASATPATYDPNAFPATFANGVPTLEPSTYYPSPYLGGEWHLRDSCAYMVTTSMAVLDVAARRREEFLYDTYQMARDAIRGHERETFVVPSDQWDAGTAVKMINVLRLGGVEVERATASFTAGRKSYAAGSFLIRGAQPFEPYVRDLLSPQVYPDVRLYPGGPPKRPYDITGWTLNDQMGVAVDRVDAHVAVPSERVDVAPVPAGSVPGGVGGQRLAFALDPRANDSFTAVNRLLKAGAHVYRTPGPAAIMIAGRDQQWPAGTFVIPPDEAPATFDWRALATSLGLQIATTDRPSPQWTVRAPRIGVYHAWGGNMDEGWTRWVLEQFEFPYTSVFDRDIRAGRLNERFDVIVLPDATTSQMVNGLTPGTMPDAYTGGMTARGVANLRAFVAGGGTLVAMDRASDLPIATFGLPVRNVTSDLPDTDFYVPGSILTIRVDATDPVAYGMPPDAGAFFINSPAFAVSDTAGPRVSDTAGTPVSDTAGPRVSDTGPRVRVVAHYPATSLLMSGWILGERYVAGRAAVLDCTFEKGRIVLLGFRTQHRAQPHGTFKLLFNSLFLAATGE